jgi:hypothetical protein
MELEEKGKGIRRGVERPMLTRNDHHGIDKNIAG